MIVTPVNWYQVTSPIKLMMDRLVCADGGNPDPSSTCGKQAKEAKAIELEGWGYSRHLEGRLFSVVVHGDVEGTHGVRQSLSDWLRFMKMVPAGAGAELDRYIGYWKPYATNHHELDADWQFRAKCAMPLRFWPSPSSPNTLVCWSARAMTYTSRARSSHIQKLDANISRMEDITALWR